MSNIVTFTSRWSRGGHVLLLALIVSGCTTLKSGSHHDEAMRFDGYQSFSWISDNPLIFGKGEPLPVSPLTQKIIAQTIEQELIGKGFEYRADADSADFVVSYTLGTRERINAAAYPPAYRGAWGWRSHGPFYYEAEVVHRSYTEGTLGVDIFDGKTKQPVWHGWASKTISASDRKQPSASIQKAVRALFSEFPPTGDEAGGDK